MTVLIEVDFLKLASTSKDNCDELFWCVPERDRNGEHLGWTLGFSVGEFCNVTENPDQDYDQVVLGDSNGNLTRFNSIDSVRDFIGNSTVETARLDVNWY